MINTIGNALDVVQARFGGFDFANLLPHLNCHTREQINTVIPEEKFDPLIKVSETNRIKFLDSHPVIDEPYVRKKYWENFCESSEYLPKGLGFGIFELYRSPERQLILRQKLLEKILFLYPNDSEIELLRKLDTFVSRVGGPHQTGGAGDFALIDLNSRIVLDMGGSYLGVGRQNYTASNLVSLEAQVHRFILCTIMTYFGFRNYPAEWWHYEYGTKRHSKYLNFDTCMYDVVNKN